MKTMENILKNRKSEQRTRVEILEEKLRSQVRLLDADKKILAENLGRICAELNPDKPLTAVSLLIEKSGLQSLQQKRKRFIRLPGEEESPIGEKGAYGASGETFATLASTAAQMGSTSNDENVKRRDKEYCFRQLLKGTSFLPVYKPEGLGGRSTKDILDEYRERLIERIAKDTRLTELWKILENTPMSIRGGVNLDLIDVGPPQYGPAQLLPDKLTEALSRAGKIPPNSKWARFFTSRVDPFYWWPSLKIGQIAIEKKIRVFHIPSDVGPLFNSDKMVGDFLPEQARKWLQKSDYYNGDRGEEEELWQVADIIIEIRRNPNGKPFLCLMAYNTYRYATNKHLDDIISLGQSQITNAEDADGQEYLFTFLLERPFSGDSSPNPIGIICEEDAPLSHDNVGWTDDDVISEILMGDTVRFFPSFDSDLSCAPFHSDCVGAALIANLKDAEKEDRIDKILIEQAQLMAEAGIGFYEAVFDETRETLLKISED